jgi:carboxypeptidase D
MQLHSTAVLYEYAIDPLSDVYITIATVVHLYYCYTGHYIPSMIAYILAENAALAASSSKNSTRAVAAAAVALPLNIAGAAIGNGWSDPYNQYDVSEYAFGAGLITEGQMRALKSKEQLCRAGLDRKQYAT